MDKNFTFTTYGKVLLVIGMVAPLFMDFVLSKMDDGMISYSVLTFLLSLLPFTRPDADLNIMLLFLSFPLMILLGLYTPLKKTLGNAFAVALLSIELFALLVVLVELVIR